MIRARVVVWDTKRDASVVNKYNYIENSKLKICEFMEITEDWLQFVVDYRSGKEHGFDIVEGPMAVEDEVIK